MRRHLTYEELPTTVRSLFPDETIYNALAPWKKYQVSRLGGKYVKGSGVDSDLRFGRQYKKRVPLPFDLIGVISEEEYHNLTELERRFVRNPGYGINIDFSYREYLILVEKQDNLCAVCHMPETEVRKGTLKRLAIDHDHLTGKVRGLLCASCNKKIDSENGKALVWARSVVEYLEKFEKEVI